MPLREVSRTIIEQHRAEEKSRLERIHLESELSKKKEQDIQDEQGAKLQREEIMKQVRSKNADYDELELAIIAKYRGVNLNSKQPSKALAKLQKEDKHKQQEYIREDYRANFVRKGGLLDQQLFLNNNAPHSYAERKWKWHGEESG